MTRSRLPTPDDIARPPPCWRTGWTAWRNRVIANPSFQHWARLLPGFRQVSRRRAGRAFDLLAGFCYSQVLVAVVEADLLETLAVRPCDVAHLATATGLSRDAALRLTRAAAALDLAEEVAPGWWMLGQQGAALRANAGALAMVRHHALLYADLADPLTLLRRNRTEPTALSTFWHYAEDSAPATASRYSTLMAASQDMVAREALGAYRFARHRRLLDLGGGHGAFVTAVARACPRLDLGVFDLPAVLAGTSARLATAGLDRAIALHPGDFFATPLPAGYDCMTLVRVLHDHDDARCHILLRAACAALPAGGRLVIAEPMADAPGARAMGDAYFGLYLWAMNSGRPRTARDYGRMALAAGFSSWRQAPTALPVIASCAVLSK
ncbi:MAG: methyltransferase [Sphingomonadales bacterium]|nr:methyltransferase [Sphingomonadales bacterium]